MKRILRPHVADYYIGGVRVIQHDVLCNQPALESIVEGCVSRAGEILEGAPLRALESVTIELFQDVFSVEGVSMAHQATVSGPNARKCSIKISVDDQLDRRVEECFNALTSHLHEKIKALTES